MNLSRIWAYSSCFYLIVAMSLGVLLRYSFIGGAIGFNYKFLVHTHSHLILLGWVFNAICALLYHQYKDRLSHKLSLLLFALFQVSLVGMFISFPIQGYGSYSIIFSTAHIFISYFFVGHVLSRIKSENSIAERFIRLSLFFFIISTFGPFSLGYIQAKGLAETPLYNLAIYYYLHFLYNGFFVLMIIGLLVKSRYFAFEGESRKHLEKAYYLIGYSVLPAYSLSVFCDYQSIWVTGIGLASGGVQFVGVIYLLMAFGKSELRTSSSTIRLMINLSLMFLVLKSTLQFLSAVPVVDQVVCDNHNLIISYLHLIFIGVLTLGLLGLLKHCGLLMSGSGSDLIGLFFVLAGFGVTELILIYPFFAELLKLSFISKYYHILFWGSCVILMGTMLIVIKIEGEYFSNKK